MDDSIRYLDPTRWRCAKEGLFLVKRYENDMGCIDEFTSKSLRDMLGVLEYWITTDHNKGWPTECYYSLFDQNGEPINFQTKVHVTCELA